MVMHSMTKYMCGHSDVVMGAVVMNNDELAERIQFIQNRCGAVAGPMDCFLVLRGMKTLHIRMQRHSENGRAVANALRNHPKVDKVFWPGFKDHPNHAIAKKQMKDFGGMMSFTLKGDDLEETLKAVSKLKVFSLAESLGGVESLVGHPASMTHAAIPESDKRARGLVPGGIRLSIGLEDWHDIIADLTAALEQA